MHNAIIPEKKDFKFKYSFHKSGNFPKIIKSYSI